MKRIALFLYLVAAVTALSPVPALAACCALNGGPCNIIPPLVHGISPWTGSICGSTISGTSCTAELDANATASSGDCLTLGAGVTLDLNGYTINCNSSDCGNAILNTASSSGTGAVSVTNGDITGCFSGGVAQTGGSNTTVSELKIDLAGSCTNNTSHGLFYITGLIDHTVVANARGTGVWLMGGKQLKNSIVRDSGTGIYYSYFGSSAAFDNVLVFGNDVNIQNATPASGIPSMQRSEIQLAGTCDCKNNTVCTDISNCVTFTNSTTPSMVNDAFVP